MSLSRPLPFVSEEERLASIAREYAQLVVRIARHLASRLPPSVLLDDLVQAGMLGLLEAAKRYEGRGGARFETYASQRIRGAMLDELRQLSWAPRGVNQKAKLVAAAIADVERETGRRAKEEEIASRLGIGLETYHEWLLEARGQPLFSFSELGESEEALQGVASGEDLLGGLERREFFAKMALTLETLPPRERLLLSLYYEEELTLKEVGEVLGVGVSRVSQLHTQAVARLRAALDQI